MENLKDALLKVLACRTASLLLSDDLNLPDIDLETNALKENPSNHRESRSFLETISELGLNSLLIPQKGEIIYLV